MPRFWVITPITLVIHTIVSHSVLLIVIKSVVHIYIKVRTVSALENIFTFSKDDSGSSGGRSLHRENVLWIGGDVQCPCQGSLPLLSISTTTASPLRSATQLHLILSASSTK